MPKIKIYYIVHIDRIDSILSDGFLYSDSYMHAVHKPVGSRIGISNLKDKRLTRDIPCHENLKVGACVPFYYCPRSIMLYLLYRGNHPNVDYKDGQSKIVHLQFALDKVFEWAQANGKRVAVTDRNAGSVFFDAWPSLDGLQHLDRAAINANDWKSCKEHKQAEFLVEDCVPTHLIERIGVLSSGVELTQVVQACKKSGLAGVECSPVPDWYY